MRARGPTHAKPNVVAEAPRTAPVVVAVAREELSVERVSSDVEKVRVEKKPVTKDVELDVDKMREQIDVERVPIGRYVDVAPEVRVEGDVVIVPVVAEVVVVEKRLVLQEEVRITKRRVGETEHLRVPVREEDVKVERVSVEQPRRK